MLAFVSLEANGERSFNFYRHPSADMLMKPEDVATDVISNAKIFHFGSITLINEPSRSATLKAAQHAKEQGLIISYDPNLRRALWENDESAKAGMLSGFDYAHIIKISDEELEFLTGDNDIEKLWRKETKVLIVTHGSAGATAYHKQTGKLESVSYKGYDVVPIDTTGAGDSFVAGLLVSILENPEDYISKLEHILCFANGVGALTTTNRGAIPALPSRAQVDAFIKRD